jgi:hypothetical protein
VDGGFVVIIVSFQTDWILATTLASDGIEDANKKRMDTALAADEGPRHPDAAASAKSLACMMHGRSGLGARVHVAKLLLANAADKAKVAVSESSELIRLVATINEKSALDRKVMDAGLSCLLPSRRLRVTSCRTQCNGAPGPSLGHGDASGKPCGWGATSSVIADLQGSKQHL